MNQPVNALAQSLHTELRGRIQELRIVECSCGLVLQGRSSSWYGKQLAQARLMALTREPLVANEIEVAR